MVIAVNPDWVDYYKSIWDFQPLPKTDVVESYSYVQGAPAVGLFLNLDTCKENLTSIYYNHFNPEQDFYSFLFKTKLDNYQFPDRSFKTVSDPVMTPELLNYFFNKCSNTFKSLSEEEKVQLRFLYLNLHNFADILPQVESNEIKSKEEREIFQKVREIRFEANCKGAIFVKVDNVITFQPLQILDVSENGIAFKSKGEVPTGLEVELRADVGYLTVSKLLVKVCHTGEDFHYGAQIINSDSYWREFLDYLQNNLTREDDIEDDKKVA